MARFRLDSIAQLARELTFAPVDTRLAQVAAAEDLLHLIDPAKAYPLDFIVFKVTGYRPKRGGGSLLTGIALQHDLGLMVEQVSATLGVRTTDLREPVLGIEDLCVRLGVTSKTIQRWRRKGLPSRRFIFQDGKQRVGFLLTSVERFIAAHGDGPPIPAQPAGFASHQVAAIVGEARRLAVQCRCCEAEIARRIARRTGRTPLAVLHLLRKHDQEHPDSAVLPLAAAAVAPRHRSLVLKAHRRGVSLKRICRKVKRSRSAVYRIILDDRLGRLAKRRVRFFDDPLFHQPDAAAAVDALVAAEELPEQPPREQQRIPRDLPPYFQDLYRIPLLGPGRERALFLKLSFHRWQFVQHRRRLDTEQARNRDLKALERHLARAGAVKNQIVRANLRLVASVARKHLRPGAPLLELISDGNLTLMRAADTFDINRGTRFSTYATLALMKGFARSVPQMLRASQRSSGDPQVLDAVADPRSLGSAMRLLHREEVATLLSLLSERERSVLRAHYGLDDESAPASFEQVGRRLGLSKERVRQIEQGAMEKLRDAAVRGKNAVT